MIEPQKVAEAILKAAVKPERDIKVGAMAKLNTTISKVAPSLGDKMSAKQVDRQQRHEPPRDPDGALYKAGESGRIEGEGAASEKSKQPELAKV